MEKQSLDGQSMPNSAVALAGKFTARQVFAYWAFIAVAPISILTITMDVPPIQVWLFFSLGFVSAHNRARHSIGQPQAQPSGFPIESNANAHGGTCGV